MFQQLLRPRLALLAGLLVALACGESVAPSNEATLILFADVSGTAVATVVVNVTAPDLPSPLVFNIPVVSGIASDTITVRAGSHRVIAMRAYDAEGVETHSGSAQITIQPGLNPTITLVMQPLTGDVPITLTLGSRTVVVSPNTLTLVVGDTSRLSASISDWNGAAVAGTVKWATNDPGVATVDDNGLVTATHAGTTTVAATFQGAGGHATVTVTP